jgi:hypothetical protein
MVAYVAIPEKAGGALHLESSGQVDVLDQEGVVLAGRRPCRDPERPVTFERSRLFNGVGAYRVFLPGSSRTKTAWTSPRNPQALRSLL